MVTMRTRARLLKSPSVGLGALTIACLLCVPGTSHAEGVEEHDGFMLRLALGLGYGQGTEEVPVLGGDLKLSGAGGFFSLDIGGALVDNLVLHGRLSNMVVASPTVYVNGEELGTAEDASLTFYLFGAGLTYYLMPANVYFTGVIGITRAVADNGFNESTTNAGFGLEGDIGKEWWVSDNWGIGVAGRFTFASVPDDVPGDDDATLNGLGFGVLFSATYQ